MKKVTVVITCFQRFKNLEKVLQSWLDQEEVDEVILFDNSGSYKTDLPVIVINVSKNYGPIARFVASQFVKNDWILFADDDILPKSNFIKDLLKYSGENKIVGVLGRRLIGSTYYSSQMDSANNVTVPSQVDYLCGIIMLTDRKNSLVDIQKCPNWYYIEDWWWERETGKKCYVVPTKNWELLPESNDTNALHCTKEIHEVREEYFKKWSHKNTEIKKVKSKVLKYPVLRNRFAILAIDIESGEFLYSLIRITKPKNVVETGTFEGFSTIHIAQALKDNGSGVVWTVDHKDYGAKKIFEEQEFSEKLIKTIIGNSPDVLKKIVSENEIDLAFLDNGHTYVILMAELEILHKHLKKNSYIIGHDYFNPSHLNSVHAAANDFYKKYQTDYEKIGIIGGEGFFVLRKIN